MCTMGKKGSSTIQEEKKDNHRSDQVLGGCKGEKSRREKRRGRVLPNQKKSLARLREKGKPYGEREGEGVILVRRARQEKGGGQC